MTISAVLMTIGWPSDSLPLAGPGPANVFDEALVPGVQYTKPYVFSPFRFDGVASGQAETLAFTRERRIDF
jgi:hypothetical protein